MWYLREHLRHFAFLLYIQLLLQPKESISSDMTCVFYDRGRLHDLCWYVQPNASSEELSQSNGVWKACLRASLVSRKKGDGGIVCSISAVDSMKARQVSHDGYADRITGVRRRAFVSCKKELSSGAYPKFVDECIRTVRQGDAAALHMCAYGVDYFFGQKKVFRYAVFVVEHHVLAFAYAIGDSGEVKVIRFRIGDCGVVEVEQGTVGRYDDNYSVLSESLQGEIANPDGILEFRVIGHDDILALPIALKNVRTSCESLKRQAEGKDFDWEAFRLPFDSSTLIF